MSGMWPVVAAGAALAENAPAQAGLADALVGAAPWPKSLAEQVAAVRAALARQVGAVSAARLKAEFKNARENRLEEILQALVALGQARTTEDGRYVC